MKVDASPPPEARILRAARRRFESLGYRSSGVAQIARDAGVAAGTIYRHFASKEAILVRVVTDLNQEWLRVARDALAEPGRPLERIARLGAASVEFNHRHRIFAAVLERDAELLYAPLLDDLYTAVMHDNVAMLAAVIREGVEDGSLAEIDPEKAAYVLFVAGRALYGLHDHPYADLLPVLTKIVSDGLLPRQEAPRV
jgi:AcrR family transcriptional regulator